MLIIPLDAEQCVNFYQDLQKKITDAMKRILGVSRLALWEGDPVLAEILDCEAAIQRIAYYYANPTDADLVNTIEEYPGLSSWDDFNNAALEVHAVQSHEVPWIRLPSIPRLKSLYLSDSQDRALTAALIEKNKKKTHALSIQPHAWMAAFNITDSEEVGALRERIIYEVRVLEENCPVLAGVYT